MFFIVDNPFEIQLSFVSKGIYNVCTSLKLHTVYIFLFEITSNGEFCKIFPGNSLQFCFLSVDLCIYHLENNCKLCP